jgi:hypothetical protein
MFALGEMSITPANKSGRSSIARPTAIPRAEPPTMNNSFLVV